MVQNLEVRFLSGWFTSIDIFKFVFMKFSVGHSGKFCEWLSAHYYVWLPQEFTE